VGPELEPDRRSARPLLGAGFAFAAYLVAVVCGPWGLFLDLAIVHRAAGFLGVVVGSVLFPVTFAVAPWYAGVAWGYWFPLLISYGGAIVTTLLVGLGSVIAGESP
jgi:hypothetical protein